MGPVGVFDLVQLGLREGVVEVLDGHLIEGYHVLKLFQLKAHTTKRENRQGFTCKFHLRMNEVF